MARQNAKIKELLLNWLDIVLLGFLAFGALRGLRIGLIGAAVTAAAMLVGWLVAGQAAAFVEGALGAFARAASIATAVIYIAVIALVVAGAQLLWSAVRPAAGAATLGTATAVDRIGGVILGLILGFALAAALILTMARLTYDAPLADVPVAADAVGDVWEGMETQLAESRGVAMFARAAAALPADALGFVPGGFGAALDALIERRL